MFQTIKNLYRQTKDAVMAFGSRVCNKVARYLSDAKSFFSPAIEGEYLGKGDIARRSFNPRSSMAFAMMFCFLMLPAISFADVPASVTAGITGAVTDVGAIGALVMGVIIAIVAFTWLKRVLSGR